ncbi:MAG TPA: methanol dehydrogenase, partial [Caulobacteraceae bacterium]|nr:methanol dehydrogenase [Caulobacteraceae bacterium]
EGGVVAGTNAIIQQLSLDPASATANVQKAAQATRPHGGVPFGAIFGLIVLFIVFASLVRRHWGGGGGMGWWLPMAIMSSGSRGSGWGGGGWGGGGSGGGFGGGGFSGGGGSFGGGGASGSW